MRRGGPNGPSSLPCLRLRSSDSNRPRRLLNGQLVSFQVVDCSGRVPGFRVQPGVLVCEANRYAKSGDVRVNKEFHLGKKLRYNFSVALRHIFTCNPFPLEPLQRKSTTIRISYRLCGMDLNGRTATRNTSAPGRPCKPRRSPNRPIMC